MLLSCSKQEKPKIAFFYWKTQYLLSTKEKNLLKKLDVRKLYIRYFDVVKNAKEDIFPNSPIVFLQKPTATVVPVLYIKNNVFLTEKLNLNLLANNMYNLVKQINKSQNITTNTIEIDCDWSLQTKEKFMLFIEEFKKVSKKEILATIRLHQIKYYQTTGIPTVKRGVLMYYNMGNINIGVSNSIYQKSIAKKYLPSLKNYPLPCDVALPIFSWAIHIRNTKIIGLRSKINESFLKNNSNFEPQENNFFKVKNSVYHQGVFYKKNDLLKIEKISNDDLLEMANDLEENLKTKPKEILFFDLDTFNINQYEKDIFEKIANRL